MLPRLLCSSSKPGAQEAKNFDPWWSFGGLLTVMYCLTGSVVSDDFGNWTKKEMLITEFAAEANLMNGIGGTKVIVRVKRSLTALIVSGEKALSSQELK